MSPALEQYFQRWCRTSDAEALGNLFDLAAPRLFKVAVHLVGDAAAAEDLVQATFLALIEQRATIDPTRPAMPWLNGVLTNKAQQLRRERAQPLDVERLHQRAVEDPSAPLEQRELSGELAAAIDKLPEPYRQVVLLRARHGMGIADIAHVVDRDPGTVTVQLHRGLERLRRMLPAALCSALLAGLFAGRGLAAVKSSVLVQASVAASATGGISILGGIVVGKKTVVAVCVALIALLAFLIRPSEQEPTLQAHSTPEPDPIVAAELPEVALAPEPADTRQALAPANEPLLTSKVVDAESGESLANVDVALFAGRETTPFELQRDHPEYYRVSSSTISPITSGDWPVVVGADELALAGRRPLLSLDKPDNRQSALARTTSDAQGEFMLPVPASPFLIEASLRGYRTRWRPVVEGTVPETIELWRERELTGTVIDKRGLKITEPLEMVLFAYSRPSPESTNGLTESAQARIEEQLRQRKGIDFQRVTTSSDGTFRTTFSNTDSLYAHVLSTGWVVESVMPPEPATPDMVVQLARTQVLHFFDAETRQPIERIRLIVRDLQHGHLQSSNELYAPNGFASFPLSDRVFASMGFGLTACSEGFEPARWTSTSRAPGSVVEVPMRRGAKGALQGRVQRNGSPVENALVVLHGHDGSMWNAESAKRVLLDAVRTRGGAFQFEVPAGKYLLGIRENAEEVFVSVEAPTTEPIVIDLEQLARMEVLVVDQDSAPRTDHFVAIQGGDDRSAYAETNDEGMAVFAGLPAGKYNVMAPDVNTFGSFSDPKFLVVELAAGQHASVRLERSASSAPRHARIALAGTEDFTGWRAHYGTGAWCDVAADGTISTALSDYTQHVEVRAPDGREWRAFVQSPTPDGTVIQLEAGSGRLQGEIVGAGNRPLRGVRVLVKPSEFHWSVGDIAPSVLTDDAGRFSFTGLSKTPQVLAFERDGRDEPMEFQLTEGAWNEQDTIRIQLASPGEEVRVTGTVRDRSAKSVPDVSIRASALIPQAAGKLSVSTDRSWTRTDSEGRYYVSLPRTAELLVRVRTKDGWSAERSLSDDGSAERVVDLTID